MKGDNVVLEKSKAYAIRIVKLYRYLVNEKKEFVISKQILRSGTSIGANITESVYAQTRNDFGMKLSIAQKEAGETGYWLDLLFQTDYLTPPQYYSIKKDNNEILKLLQAITKTLYKK
ncbi:MAG: four helix bundle protein [Muribaculaceae bacterium]|nr:four helix bundle protein [Muribaculaceae bacterium]